ncbi:class I SAM-dependent methyltransferase [Candidatus Bathyarchaeota archaeon]|jgi:SAM-dependent methyltransferase|nr:class I SAM-dependent methyltransferase [Candidatus Bathyarchaeota archaeon]MBT4320874.1 class I SAM-dependent methyltransferase [Candidatus Bathyarchaeota archaeon]MBT4423147.1 class I SAM-dependent methyltransferase [Candidatus Bathyarchaeota archaeon]MBT7187229.1 class I SAM-dependent methyltransferase [Candidatus Bathyarchaeota archaeon]MBT7347634.1 class I SAM-dependent methyltransferase [Candidatus Bathyarchaeota archaeon]
MRPLKDILDLNKKAWDNIAGRYDERSGALKEFSDVFNAFTGKLPRNGRVLDLGCGTGLPYASHLVKNGFDVLGVDLSEEMVKVATRNVPEAKFVQRSMSEIEYRDKFDGALSSFSMLLLTPELFRETASRIYASLVDGGCFYLSLNEPGNDSHDPVSDVFVNLMGQDMYTRGYRVEEIEGYFLPLGFSLVKFHRETQVSEEFGEEHVIEFIFQKSGKATV